MKNLVDFKYRGQNEIVEGAVAHSRQIGANETFL
jgi:hypothetical protein